MPPLSEGQENIGLFVGEQGNNKINEKKDSNSANKDGTENNNKERNMNENDVKTIDNNVILSELKSRLLDGRLATEKAASELESAGFVSSKLLDEIKQKNASYEVERLKIFDELKELNITTIEGLVEFIKKQKQADKEGKEKEEFEKNYNEVLQEKGLIKDGKPTGTMHEFVIKWAGCNVGMSKGEMASRVDKVLNDEHFKKSATANIGSPKIETTPNGKQDVDVDIYDI